MQQRNWTDILLLHLIRDQGTIARLHGKLEPADVANVMMDATKGALWAWSREYYDQSGGQPIPQHFLEAKLVERIDAGQMQQIEVDSIAELLGFVYSVQDSELNTNAAMDYAKRLLEEERVHRPVREAVQDGASVADLFETIQSGVSAASIGMPEPIDPLDQWEKFIGAVRPVPIGGADVAYFNHLVNGGLVPGEIVVMLGPMGGYKTTIGLDLLCSMAKRQEYSMFLSYEQAWQGGDLPIRMISRLSGISRNELLKEGALERISAEQSKIINEAKQFSKYILIQDRSQYSDRVGDIVAQVRELKSRGKLPKLIVLDQLMTWMQSWPEFANPKDTSLFRREATNIIKALKSRVCEAFGTRMLVLHQITAAAIGKTGGQSFMHTDSAEVKSIGFWSDFVISIGTKKTQDDIELFKMVAGKTRRGPNTSILVRATPATCTFQEAIGWQEDRNGSFVRAGFQNSMNGAPPAMQGSADTIV